jgi:peptidoglycan hydrolase CwlO-like protein
MTIEVGLIIALIGLIVSVYFNITSASRAARNENKQDASCLTTVIVKLENIGSDVKEIKTDMSNLKTEIKSITERLVVVEQSTKSAHKRIDELGGASR